MAEWSKDKVNPTNINGGKEFTTDDVLTVAELNGMVNNSFYAVDFAEAMADEPDISEIAGDGVPSVSFVDNGKFKRLKFSNLKGKTGATGSKMVSQVLQGQDADGGNIYLQTFDDGTTATFTAPKGESGDSSQPVIFELELEILKTTDSFATSFNNHGQIFTSTNFKYERDKYQKLNTDVYNSILEQAGSHKICFVTINGATYMGETYLPTNKSSFEIYIYYKGYSLLCQ